MRPSLHTALFIATLFALAMPAKAAMFKSPNGCESFFDTSDVPRGGRLEAQWKGACVDNKADGEGKQNIFFFQGAFGEPRFAAQFEGLMRAGMPVTGKLRDAKMVVVYEGAFKNGLREGQGSSLGTDGERYVGGFAKGLRAGFGVKTAANGKTESGLWREGRLQLDCASEADCVKAQEAKEAELAATARQFAQLGVCLPGETVYHREAWDASTSSGNFIADALFNATQKESFILVFEGIVKGTLGKKVEVYLQDYSIRQTQGSGPLRPVTGVKGAMVEYADKRLGRSHFFDKARCEK